jgi:FKBP-type peptidyl-prolyl cis-trans isomerase 2
MDKFMRISYTGKVKDTGKIFDTTSEKVAKDEGIFNKEQSYGPLPIVLGEGQVIKGLEEILGEMKTGEKKTIEIPPEKAFGRRDPNLVRLVSRGLFKKHNINPIPGMVVELDGKPARIQTVAGGRVRVDFNSELAGKTVVYEVRVESIAKTKKEKVEYLLERSFNSSDGFGINLKEKSLKISLPEKVFKDRNVLVRKASFAGEIFKYLGVEEVIFEEHWMKKKSSDVERKKER